MLSLCAILLTACAPSSATAPIPEQWRSVAITTHAAQLGAERVGALRFRGGLAITTSDAGFGGLSDVKVFDDDRLLAESDDGEWFSAHVVLDRNGNLVGLSEPQLALMRDEHGHPFENKRAGDAEDLAQLPDGRVAVSFEQTQTIRIYDLNRDGPFGAATPGPPLAGTGRLPNNVGLEALASDGDDGLIVGAERSNPTWTDIWHVRLDAPAPAPPVARYPLEWGFALSSLDRMPNGDYIAVERFYAPVIGARIRISTIARASIDHGPLRKTVLATLGPPLRLDNFEGVTAVRGPNGAMRIYIMTDNDFDEHRPTLLYAFDIVGSGG